MKPKFLFIFPALFVFFQSSVFAQNTLYKPFTSFQVIKTDHFNIIFPKESETSARLLASYADSVYTYVSSLLGVEVPGRISVSLSPHTDLFNGYYNVFYNHIMLYDTPMDVEWSNFENNLEKLFLHELTHAVSLNSRSRYNKFLHRIFGWALPAYINANQFMLEGVAVSFESLDGTGRANDPRIKQYLSQAVYENKFLTPFQASGVYDIPNRPNGYWYEYGGLFSAWLQKTYGMEKYAMLWQEMGKGAAFSFFLYRSGFYRIFKKVYGVDFLTAWNNFKAVFALEGLENNEDEVSSRKYRYFSEREYFIGGLTARENNLYFIESSETKIGVYDTLTGKTRTFNSASGVYDLDVSQDGKVMLLSGYQYIEDRAIAVVTEHKTENGRKTGRDFKGLYKARYFRDGVIGIRSKLHNNCIVYENFNGKSEVLFAGNENLMFSGPQPVDDDRIVFIALRNGKRELWLYDYVSRELYKIENTQNTTEDNKYWDYMRGLRVSEGKLFFSYNPDNRMYKLGIIDLYTMQASLSGREFSGGVFNPVSASGNIYYLATFVSRNGILRFPESASSLSGQLINLRLVKQDNHENDTNPQIVEQPVVEPPYTGLSKPYISLRYMNPFKLWLPLPLIRQSSDENSSLKLDGGGILSVMSDPIDRNTVYFLAYADTRYKMALVDQFVWQNTGMGFPLSINFSDKVTESGNKIQRHTSAGLSGSINWITNRWNNTISIGGGYYRNAGYENKKSAYEWEETGSGFFAQTGFVFSYRRLSLQFSGASLTNIFEPHIDMIFRANTKTRFPMSFTLFGAYDKKGMDLHGISDTFGSTPVGAYTLNEYPHPSGLNLFWLGGCDIAVGLFSFEIQKNLSHFYFNRFFGSISIKNQIYDGNGSPDAAGIEINNLRYVQSLGFKLGIKTSIFPVIKTPMSVEPFLYGAWKISDTINGKEFPLYVNAGINITL